MEVVAPRVRKYANMARICMQKKEAILLKRKKINLIVLKSFYWNFRKVKKMSRTKYIEKLFLLQNTSAFFIKILSHMYIFFNYKSSLFQLKKKKSESFFFH